MTDAVSIRIVAFTPQPYLFPAKEIAYESKPRIYSVTNTRADCVASAHKHAHVLKPIGGVRAVSHP